MGASVGVVVAASVGAPVGGPEETIKKWCDIMDMGYEWFESVVFTGGSLSNSVFRGGR